MRLKRLRFAWGLVLLLLCSVVTPARAGLQADVERSGPLSLRHDPGASNYPSFFSGQRMAPYREPPSPRFQPKDSQQVTNLRVDLDRRVVVVELVRGTVPLSYPWIAPIDRYLEELSRFIRRAELSKLAASGVGRGAARSGEGLFNIDIPVRFPRTLSRIIGQGANIQVSGSESITFSGETQYYIKDRDNESGGQRKFPELDMRQQLQVNLTGTIGEKVKVEVQHNSESQVPLENRIKLRYEGFEDEVIQRIEVGNTNLSLPGNQFVSFSANQQGLFGVKMVGKAGKLDFTTILSQQQGRTDQETYRGQSRQETKIIDDLDYVKNRYFVINEFRPIDSLWVYLDDDNVNNNDGSQVRGRAFLDGDTSAAATQEQKGWFDELVEVDDYYLNRDVGILRLNRSVPENATLGVSYFADGVRTGNTTPVAIADSNVVLKLIRPPIEFYKPTDPTFGGTWYYQLRNAYDLGGRQILEDGFELKIYRKAAGAEERFDQQGAIPFIRIMGLDLADVNLVQNPDDMVDALYQGIDQGCGTNLGIYGDTLGIPPGDMPYYPTAMVDFNAGLLYFPDLRPFDPAYMHYCDGNVTLEERNSVIYDNHDPRPTDSKYEIEVTYRTSQASFSLNRSNILEGSEVVKLNGRTLTRGTDYRIIYEIGQIEFLTDEALEPDADITVDFEYAPFLSQAQKSLVGAAGTYNLSDRTTLSSIWLYKGKKTPYRRPRLGQEPSRIVVGGLSMNTRQEPAFLTSLADWIPGVTARQKSEFSLSLETAATFPNPNTKNAVYIDDMEGTEETSSFGITRRQWDRMSIPLMDAGTLELDPTGRYREIWWYNPKNAATRGDLNPRLSQEERIKFVPVLEVALQDGTIAGGGGEGAWGGIMRLVSKTGLDLKERKFFEVWINDFNLNQGKVHVDMGLLGEDAMWSEDPPNEKLDSEDKLPYDGLLDDSGNNGPNDEDTGLDGLFNPAEPGEGGDPAGDDWAYDENRPNDYSSINGTEGNGFLDTEDLNGNGIADEEKAYFRFTIDLGSDEFLAATGTQNESKNWRLFRIPLAKALERQPVSPPTFDKGVKYVRLWFEDLGVEDARFQIYSLEVTGNRWLEAGIQDGSGALIDSSEVDPLEIFAAGVINNKDGEPYDPPPVEIIVEREVPEKEQSLVLNYENLHAGHTGSVFRALFDEEDYTRYEEIEFWVRRAEPKTDSEPYPVFFYRFGGDSLNFYEVRDTLTATGWKRIVLDLAEMTQVKLLDPPGKDSLYGREVDVRIVNQGDLVLRAVGAPSMTKVRRLTFGVTNTSSEEDLTGVIWVDDLRLINVKGDPGFAGRVGVDLSLSDFLQASSQYRKVGKDFRRITGGGDGTQGEENPRVGSDETELSFSGTVKMGEFLEGIGVGMPVSASWSKTVSQPELKTGSDIVLEDPSEEKTERKATTASVTISRVKRAESPWLYYTLDAMNVRVAGRRNSNYNPTKIDSSWAYSVDWSYKYAPRFQSELTLLRGWKIDPLPKNIGLSAHKEVTESRSLDVRSDSRRIVDTRTSTSNFDLSMSPIKSESFTSDFAFSSARDHIHGKPLPFLSSVNQGLEVRRNHNTKVSYTPRFSDILSWFKPRLSYSTRYTEDMPIGQRQVETDPDTGDTLSVITLHNVQNTNNSSVDFGVGLSKLFELIPEGQAPAPEDSGSSRFGPMALVRGIRSVGTRIGEISATVSLGRDSRYDRLTRRPSLMYQFGFTDEVDSLDVFRRAGQTVTSSRTQDLGTRASSSVRLIPSMSLSFTFNQSLRKSESSGNAKESKSTTWPDLTYNWDGLDGFWKIGNYLTSASLDVGFNQRKDLSGKTLSNVETERVSKNWDPLFRLDAEWTNGLRSSLSADQSTEINKSFRGGSSESVRSSQGVTASFSYKVSSRKRINIPILGKGTKGGSFTATTTFGLDFRYSTSKDEQKRPYRLDGHTRDFNIRPRVTWTWLQNLSGSLELRFGERRDLKNENRSTRTIGASISALFRF